MNDPDPLPERDAASGRRPPRAGARRARTLPRDLFIDYKNVTLLRQFISDRGKILPRRLSGANAVQQRQITVAVARARMLALLPYTVTEP